MKIIQQSFSVLNLSGNLQLLEYIGRKAYKSGDRITETSAEPFIRSLLKHKPPHEAVIEHSLLTVEFVTNRAIANELVRHRICAFLQESTRFVNFAKKGGIECIEPYRTTGHAREIWQRAMEAAEDSYNAMLSHGSTPEIARGVLPLDLATTLVVSTNFRQWRHMFRMRGRMGKVIKAHPQMRELMENLHAYLLEKHTVLALPIFDFAEEKA